MKHEELLAKYARKRADIAARLAHFEQVGKKGGRSLFEELCFCLLTPQSKARSCNSAIQELKEKRLLFNGDASAIAKVLSTKTRFHNNKARYLVEARAKFGRTLPAVEFGNSTSRAKFAANNFAILIRATFSGTERQAREYFVKNVKGLGLKEASHYLRNVGRGSSLAILDRHILKNLAKEGAIDVRPFERRAIGKHADSISRVPSSLTKKRYLQIEKEMEKFCRKTGVPLAHLDLLFWAEETGEIFK
jgi:N-glycosylase/DNA lyase